MFGKLFSQIGGIFGASSNNTNVSEKQIETNFDTSAANSAQANSVKRLPDSPSAAISSEIEGETTILIEDNVNASLLIKPMRRYGRICDCPKDPNFSMFCSRARNWYQSTSTGSLSITDDTEVKYAKLKATYNSLT